MFLSKTKRSWIAAATLVLLLVSSAFTETLSQTKKKRTVKYYTVPANQVMRVRLNDELDSEKARVGAVSSVAGLRAFSVRRRKASRRSSTFSLLRWSCRTDTAKRSTDR